MTADEFCGKVFSRTSPFPARTRICKYAISVPFGGGVPNNIIVRARTVLPYYYRYDDDGDGKKYGQSI